MDLGVRPQTQVLWDDDIGPETNVDVDNSDQPRDSRPESSQGDVVDGSSESDDEEWKYVKGAKDKLNDNDDSKYQLNPNATEFVPVFPNVEKEDIIASSPGIGQTSAKDLDDISVPSETEFDHDISTRACDLEPASELDDMFNSSTCHKEEIGMDNKSDGVTLLLSNENLEEKVDTNPFTNNAESAPAKTDSDNVDFVSDYFGKNELDFKPFESVSSHQMVPDKIFESNETADSHIPNSVSAEISSHFGFIDKHLDSNDILKIDETEKERNHLEIKEPESPIDPENLTNGLVNHPVQNDSEHLNIESLQEDENEFLVESHFESRIVKDEVLEPEVLESESHNDEQSDFVHEVIDEFKPTAPSLPVEPAQHMYTNPFGDHESVVDEIKTSPVEEMLAEASSDNIEVEKNDVEKPLSPEPEFVNHTTVSENEVVINNSPMEVHLEEQNATSEVKYDETNDVANDITPVQQFDQMGVSDLVFHEEHIPNEPMDVINTRLQDLSMSAVCPGTPVSIDVDVSQTHVNMLANSTQDYDDNHFDIEEDKVNLNENNAPHQIDTIEPNAFNFSQPYEVDRNESPDFISLRKNNDIMTTSMHESLEHESSFEFISESAAREAAIAEDNEVEINSENKSEPVNEITDINEAPKLQNGFDHIESRPDILSSIVESNSAIESESAIVESHEMPISREPDVVFVEQICPSVEVTSEEGSPVGKENGTLETALTAAGITAAVATAAVATAAVAAADQEKPDVKKEVAKSDTKTTSKPTTKAAPAKKPMTAVKSVPAKPTAAKAPPAKPASTLAAKPKAPISSRTSTTTSAAAPKPKPATTATKPLVKTTPAPASARAPTKPSVPSATARPATGVKLAARPTSAPSKTATTTKSTVAPRVPLTAAKKPAVTSTLTSKTTTAPRPAMADKPKPAPTRSSLTATSRTTTAAKTTTTAAKPPTRLGLTSSTLSSKPKTTSPTKPLPLKAKSPLVAAKKPTTAAAKKSPMTVLDKNAKNAVKAVPRPPKEIVSEEKKEVSESVISTTNGHHIENGNITPLDDVASNII